MAENPQNRKIAFVLGAGASFGAGAFAIVRGGGKLPIPMQANFWDAFLRFTNDRNRYDLIQTFLFHYFTRWQRVPAKLSAQARRDRLRDIDVEEVFTFLSERSKSNQISGDLKEYFGRVQSALLSEIGHVFSRFESNRKTRLVYKKMRENHIRARDSVISFNYDCIFENSVPRKYWHYRVVHPNSSTIKVFKPHGSVNWQIDNRGQIIESEHHDKSLIVAPSHLKFVGQQRTTRILDVWREMEVQLFDVKVLVFIGYSFPAADLFFSSVLRTILARREKGPRVVIVNPDAPSINERLRKRFSLETKIVNFFDIDSFVRSSRGDVLDALGIR